MTKAPTFLGLGPRVLWVWGVVFTGFVGLGFRLGVQCLGFKNLEGLRVWGLGFIGFVGLGFRVRCL